jgi:hypothetical protein
LDQTNTSGIWFFGLAGCGKTFASKFCSKFIENPFIIDGDDVRKLISFDLGYSSSDRNIQINRVLGLAQIAIINRQFPVVSTVTMTREILSKCQGLGIEVVEIIRPMAQLHKVRTIYRTDQDVVGKNLKQNKLDTFKIHNNGDQDFEYKLASFVK